MNDRSGYLPAVVTVYHRAQLTMVVLYLLAGAIALGVLHLR